MNIIEFIWKKDKSKLQVNVETELNNWIGEKYKEEDIINSLKWRLESKIADLVVDQLKVEIDKLALEGLAQKLIKDYDFETPIKNHMQKTVEEYLTSTRKSLDDRRNYRG